MKYLAILSLLILSGCATIDRNTRCWYDTTYVCERGGTHCYPVERQHCLKDPDPRGTRIFR